MEIERLKLKVKDSVESQRQQLIQLSLNIHDKPELGFKEEKASAWLTSYLEDSGFHVERGIADLATELFERHMVGGAPELPCLLNMMLYPK